MNIKLSVAVLLSVSALSQVSAASFVSNPGAGLANGAIGNIDSYGTAWISDDVYTVAKLGVYAPLGLAIGETVTVSLWDGGPSLPFSSSSAALGSVSFTSADDSLPRDSSGYVYKSLVSNISLSASGNYGLTARGWTTTKIDASNVGGPVPTYGLNSAIVDLYSVTDTVGNPFSTGASGYSTASTILSLASFQTAAVPEPETYAMLAGLGLVGFGLYRRCRN